ncbi:MAG: RDD family protein [Flavobacterium sp.]
MYSQKQVIRMNDAMLASHGKRFANFVVDYIMHFVISFIIGIALALLSFFFDISEPLIWVSEMNQMGEIMLGAMIILMYYLLMESITGRTIGKYITGTKILKEDGSELTPQDVFIRTLCRFIPFEAFSFLGTPPRGWHDSLSKTVVVDVKKYEIEVFKQTAIDEIGKEEII